MATMEFTREPKSTTTVYAKNYYVHQLRAQTK